jgi:2,3,4,5-tetrahydropyridine-2,6-dicarboxylate N-succinyltransferase
MSDIEKIINDAWENRDNVNQDSEQSLKDTINQMIADLDSGKVRVAEKINGEWVTHQHIKKAIMLSFRIYPMENLNGPYSSWYDKAHLLKGKTAGWTKEDHEKAGFRMVPNSPCKKRIFCWKKCGTDAMLCKYWSIYRRGNDVRHFFEGGVLLPGRKKLSYLCRKWNWRRLGTRSSITNYY